jgi:hypothetical protein
MDPLGFGLENYDPVGRWRTELEGKPLDTVGVLPSGEKFDGPEELKKLLVEKRRGEFVQTIVSEAGFPISDGENEVSRAAQTFLISAEEGKRLAGPLSAGALVHGVRATGAIAAEQGRGCAGDERRLLARRRHRGNPRKVT